MPVVAPPRPVPPVLAPCISSLADRSSRARGFTPLLHRLQEVPIDAIPPLAASSPSRALALLLLLDQIPRNVFRGAASARVFSEFGPRALALAQYALARSRRLDHGPDGGAWKANPLVWLWFSLPLGHSEDIALHRRGFELLDELKAEIDKEKDEQRRHAARATVARLEGPMEEHMQIVERFGRYPHRNKSLGRKNTPEEQAWLDGDERPQWTK